MCLLIKNRRVRVHASMYGRNEERKIQSASAPSNFRDTEIVHKR